MFELVAVRYCTNIGTFNIGPFKHRHFSYGRCLNAPMFDQLIQTLALQTLATELRTTSAKGHRGKSFSGCRGANEYVQLYAPQF